MRNVRILEVAAMEAAEAAAWYEAERPGLGKEFSNAVDAALDLIEEDIFPLLLMPGLSGAMRAKRIVLRRFPFSIVIVERPSVTMVVAFAHQSRKPGYWRYRII